MLSAVSVAFLGGKFFSSQGIRAQTTESAEKSLEEKVDSFFQKLSQPGNHFNSAFEELFREGMISSRASTEAVENISRKYQDLNSFEVGQLREAEKIGSEKIGKDVLMLRYLSKHDNAPVAWTFIFYRPPRSSAQTSSQWNTILIRFDTDLEAFSQYAIP